MAFSNKSCQLRILMIITSIWNVNATGGSSGIGKATAKEVLKRGTSLVTLWARNKGKLEDAREEIIKETGGRVNIFSVDVTGGLSGIHNVFEETIRDGGDLRMVIHCAGSSMAGTIEDTSIEDYNCMMNINYFGTVNVTKVVLPHLKKENKEIPSRITLISSIAGVMGLYGFTAYSASKFALRGFAESLEMEVRPHGISVTFKSTS
ncbi:KDSR [Lepeophtheirus salmonis]|uniref:KDSR n=1 Tax=Lepeophtheirus salmonis TaxID=72036 RepID=A0A7R8GZR0_LEPSM|nr:KDSR [Lepeophtheirus salmonis]CAF2769104.1 KDSR [Lepeophtheirus salmonis]